MHRVNIRVLRKNFRKLDCKVRLLTYFLMNYRLQPREFFAGAWRIVDSVPRQRSTRTRVGIPTRHARHHELRQVVKQLYPNFSPDIVVDEEIICKIRSSPSVIATLHSMTEFALCAALDRAGTQSAIITSTPFNVTGVENYDFSTFPENILRDRNVFVQARDALKRGRVVVCDVDHRLDLNDPNSRLAVSAQFFEFTRAVKATLFYGFAHVLDDGKMQCILEPASVGSSTARDDAISFIEFIDRCKGEPSALTIQNWSRTAVSARRTRASG